jgi:hypothetical protein
VETEERSRYTAGLTNIFCRRVPKLPKNLEEIFPRAHWKFEEQNKVLEPSIIIINSFIIIIIIIIINLYYNYAINT